MHQCMLVNQGHALVKARGFLGSVCVCLTSMLWCFDMCSWRPLFLARPATNFVSKFWQAPLRSLPLLASGSARPKHRGKWRFFHSLCPLFLICLTIQAEWIRPKKPTCGRCIVYLQRLLLGRFTSGSFLANSNLPEGGGTKARQSGLMASYLSPTRKIA